jgi:hypothetical protein
MSDDTRKLLKVFGVTVTDFEAEAQRIVQAAEGSGVDSVKLLADASEALREMNARLFEVTSHVHGVQDRLLTALAASAKR